MRKVQPPLAQKKKLDGPPAWQACPECGRKVWGVAQANIVMSPQKHLAIETGAIGNQAVVLLCDPPEAKYRLWEVGAVPTPKKFVVNWNHSHGQKPAIFKTPVMAAKAIRAWWKDLHEIHKKFPADEL